MAYTRAWDETYPADSQLAKLGAQDVRYAKQDVRERVASFGADILANRPTPEASFAGVTFLATDTGQLFRWNGAGWDDISASMHQGARVYNSIAQNVPQNAVTPLSFDTERYDDGSFMAVPDTKFTITVPGRYFVGGSVAMGGSSPPGEIVVGLRVNGVTTIAQSSLAAAFNVMSLATIWKFSAADYVELVFFQNTNPTVQILAVPAASPEFFIEFIGV